MVAIGCDHSGVALKKEIIAALEKAGEGCLDLGVADNVEAADYPVYGKLVAEKVADGTCAKGIVICGTGIGISMAANKVPGVRCALCINEYMARNAREHNDANVLALGARVVGTGLALSIVSVFMSSEKLGGRHAERVQMLNQMDDDMRKGTDAHG